MFYFYWEKVKKIRFLYFFPIKVKNPSLFFFGGFTCLLFMSPDILHFFLTFYFVTFLLFTLLFMGPDIFLLYLFTSLLFHFAWFLLLCTCSLLLPK